MRKELSNQMDWWIDNNYKDKDNNTTFQIMKMIDAIYIYSVKIIKRYKNLYI